MKSSGELALAPKINNSIGRGVSCDSAASSVQMARAASTAHAAGLALALIVIAASAVAPALARPFAHGFPDEGALFGKAKGAGLAGAGGARADASTLAFVVSEGAVPAGTPCSFKPGLIDVPVPVVGAEDAPSPSPSP